MVKSWRLGFSSSLYCRKFVTFLDKRFEFLLAFCLKNCPTSIYFKMLLNGFFPKGSSIYYFPCKENGSTFIVAILVPRTGNCPLGKYLFHSAAALPQLILNHAGPQHCNNWKWLQEAFRLCYVTWNPKVWPAEKTYRDLCCVSYKMDDFKALF